MDKPILIVDINPAHLSAREKALRAVYGQPGGIVLDAIAAEAEPRPTAVPVKRLRNFDIEGPEREPQPVEPLTRQQRRKAERLAAKKHR